MPAQPVLVVTFPGSGGYQPETSVGQTRYGHLRDDAAAWRAAIVERRAALARQRPRDHVIEPVGAPRTGDFELREPRQVEHGDAVRDRGTLARDGTMPVRPPEGALGAGRIVAQRVIHCA